MPNVRPGWAARSPLHLLRLHDMRKVQGPRVHCRLLPSGMTAFRDVFGASVDGAFPLPYVVRQVLGLAALVASFGLVFYWARSCFAAAFVVPVDLRFARMHRVRSRRSKVGVTLIAPPDSSPPELVWAQ